MGKEFLESEEMCGCGHIHEHEEHCECEHHHETVTDTHMEKTVPTGHKRKYIF